MLQSFERIKTEDFEEFRDWNLANGIEINHRQLQRGRGESEAGFAVFDGLILWSYRESRRILAEFSIPKGWVEICLSDQREQPIWCGHKIPSSSSVIHVGGQTYECVLPAGGMTHGVMIPESIFFDSDADICAGADRCANGKFISKHTSPFRNQVFAKIKQLMKSEMNGRDSIRARSELIFSCQKLADEISLNSVSFSKGDKEKLVEQATQLIRDRRSETFTVNDLIKELNVSRRKLEMSFQRQLGITPYQLLIIERLCAARQQLKRSRKSVLSVSLEVGFNDASRFAKMYARHFGELPSETSRRSSN